MIVIVLGHCFGVVSYAVINNQNTYTYENSKVYLYILTALKNHLKNEELLSSHHWERNWYRFLESSFWYLTTILHQEFTLRKSKMWAKIYLPTSCHKIVYNQTLEES